MAAKVYSNIKQIAKPITKPQTIFSISILIVTFKKLITFYGAV